MAKTTREDTKRAAIKLLTRGLATKSEMARFAGVSKQLMQHWAADIDIERARDVYLSELWRKSLGRRRAR
jgi:hypothetical protein